MSIVDGKNTRFKGKPLPTAPNYAAYVPADNHTRLHQQYVPPAYMIDPNVTYAGTVKDSGVAKSTQNIKPF